MSDKTNRRAYGYKLTRKAIEAICEVRDFACSNRVAKWMPKDEAEYWQVVEVQAESARSDLDDIIKTLDELANC